MRSSLKEDASALPNSAWPQRSFKFSMACRNGSGASGRDGLNAAGKFFRLAPRRWGYL